MRRQAGYTLLEMVVVIALLSLATAMVAPAGWRMAASWQEAARVEEVAKSLAALPLLARDEGRELRFAPTERDTGVRIFAAHDAPATAPEPDDIAMISLPEGWTLDFDQPLVVRANGACSDSRGTLRTARQRVPFEIDAPFCAIRLLPAGTP